MTSPIATTVPQHDVQTLDELAAQAWAEHQARADAARAKQEQSEKAQAARVAEQILSRTPDEALPGCRVVYHRSDGEDPLVLEAVFGWDETKDHLLLVDYCPQCEALVPVRRWIWSLADLGDALERVERAWKEGRAAGVYEPHDCPYAAPAPNPTVEERLVAALSDFVTAAIADHIGDYHSEA